MVKKIVSELLGPFQSLRFHKPKEWAENLKPAASRPAVQETPNALQQAIQKAQKRLLNQQNLDDGYWCGDLRADTTLESDTIMLLNFLGRGQSPKVRSLANFILSEQLPDGGWPIFRNGPSDLSATVKAYWALKFAGHSPDEAIMARARQRIQELGGIHRVNTYSKFYMAIFGLYDWEGVPTIPPEMMVFPDWFYYNIYEMSAWTRSIVVPLTIIWSEQPNIMCPPHARLDELFPDARRFVSIREVMHPHGFFSWTSFFLWWDRGLKMAEGRGPHWIRLWALRLAERWILERLEDSDGLGAIFPGIINTIMAMKCLGYSDHDPRLVKQMKILEDLEMVRGDAIEMQPCLSPIWDTSISVIALAESGLHRDHPALVRAAQWLLSKEIRRAGDWQITNLWLVICQSPARGFPWKEAIALLSQEPGGRGAIRISRARSRRSTYPKWAKGTAAFQ